MGGVSLISSDGWRDIEGPRGRAFLSHQGRATAGVCVGGGGGGGGCRGRHGIGGRGQSDQHREAGM